MVTGAEGLSAHTFCVSRRSCSAAAASFTRFAALACAVCAAHGRELRPRRRRRERRCRPGRHRYRRRRRRRRCACCTCCGRGRVRSCPSASTSTTTMASELRRRLRRRLRLASTSCRSPPTRRSKDCCLRRRRRRRLAAAAAPAVGLRLEGACDVLEVGLLIDEVRRRVRRRAHRLLVLPTRRRRLAAVPHGQPQSVRGEMDATEKNRGARTLSCPLLRPRNRCRPHDRPRAHGGSDETRARQLSVERRQDAPVAPPKSRPPHSSPISRFFRRRNAFFLPSAAPCFWRAEESSPCVLSSFVVESIERSEEVRILVASAYEACHRSGRSDDDA